MEIKKVWTTPAEAKALLETNTHNRTLSPTIVEKLRSDMNAGRWNEDTAEPLKVSRDGVLLDGQHRLSALATSSLAGLNLWIAYGVPAEAQEFMDLGKSRTAQDILRLRHPEIQALPVVAGMCRWLAAMPVLGADASFNSRIKASGITAHQIVDVFESDAERIQQAAIEAHRFNSVSKVIPPTVVGYCWYQIDKVDRGAAAEFFGAIKSLSFSQGEDPRRATYEQCRRVYLNPDISNGAKETSAIFAAVLTRGYNAWAEGRDIKVIRYRDQSRLLEPVKPVARRH